MLILSQKSLPFFYCINSDFLEDSPIPANSPLEEERSHSGARGSSCEPQGCLSALEGFPCRWSPCSPSVALCIQVSAKEAGERLLTPSSHTAGKDEWNGVEFRLRKRSQLGLGYQEQKSPLPVVCSSDQHPEVQVLSTQQLSLQEQSPVLCSPKVTVSV